MILNMKLIDKVVSNKRNIILFLTLLTIISSITLFLIPNMSRGHDLAFHLSRISALKDNLKLGIIGGYIYPNYLGGYGYANPLFYPDLFLYIPALLSYFGLSVITSYKIFLFLISFISILTMYITVKGISKSIKCALISSILYGFAAYRLIDVFTRAALGEMLAFVFAPLVIYGIYEIVYGDYKKYYLLVIGMSCLILSHLISTFVIGIILVIFFFVNIKKLWNEKNRILYIVISALITLGITAYFIFPMLEQMMSGKFLFNNLNETSKLMEYSLPLWSVFFEIPNLVINKLWIPTGIGIGFLLLIYYYIKNFKKCSSFIHFCFITAILFIICSTNIFPWNLFQNILFPIQFPWRLYFISVLLLSIGGGVLISKIKLDTNKTVVEFFVICLIPVINIGILNFNEQNIKEVGEYDISFAEYMPVKGNKEYILERGDIITSTYPLDLSFVRNGLNLEISFSNNTNDNSIELPLLYYKGYKAIINDKELEVYESDNGLVVVNIGSTNKGVINVNYGGTEVQLISKTISLIFVICFIMLIIKQRCENNGSTARS